MGSFCKITSFTMSTFALVTKDHPQQPKESIIAYSDRIVEETHRHLIAKKKLSAEEKKELVEVEQHLGIRTALHGGGVPRSLIDKNMQGLAERLQLELAEQYGNETPIKRLLIDRIIAAWGMVWSYELMFRGTKYKLDAEGYQTFDYSADKMRFIRETRQGIESANDQILRLTQALQNINTPQIHVKTKNAFFAQNQQVNQGVSPKDLAHSPEPSHVEKPPYRTSGDAAHS